MIHPCVRLQLVGACQSGRVERIAQQMLATACALLTAAQCSHVLLALSLRSPWLGLSAWPLLEKDTHHPLGPSRLEKIGLPAASGLSSG